MKERITITIDKELLSWLDSRVDSKVFANRSHGFEFLIFEGSNEEGTNRTDSKETANNTKNLNQRIHETSKSDSNKKSSNENDDPKKNKNNED